jgi:hypothetical protein
MTSSLLGRECPTCQGRGWVRHNDFPTECSECTPTKLVKGKVVLDAKAQAALLKRRKDDNVVLLKQGNAFTPEPPFVDDTARNYDYD